jgi:H+/gluconate symporter-like permease
MSNNSTVRKNTGGPSTERNSDLPTTDSERKMDLDISEDEWMKHFNADMFEPYSPSNPFFIHSLLKDLDKHQQMLERRHNVADFVGSNNIAVIVSLALLRFHTTSIT